MYASGLPVGEIAEALDRSGDAVTARRRVIGVEDRRRAWAPREDALIRAAAEGGLSAARVAERLGRTADAVRARRRALVGPRAAPVPYGPAEDEAIRACFTKGGDVRDLARSIGRSVDAVRLRARALGVHRPARRARWSAPEDAVIRDGYADGLTCAAVARMLPGRTAGAVAARAARLGLSNYARRWSAADDLQLVRLLAAGRPLPELARALVRTPEAVRQRIRHLGLSTAPAPRRAARAGRPWSEADDEILRLHAGINPAVLAQVLGRSDLAVVGRLRELGLRAARERSPHHPARRSGGMTPGQRTAITRVREPLTPTRLLELARRLDLPPELVRRQIDGTVA